MSHIDSIRPGGVFPPGMVMGASDYIRWDINQAKTINGDLGTAPASGGVSWTGVPLLSVSTLVVTVTTGGVGAAAQFVWFLNGVQQGAASSVSSSHTLGSTGITAHFDLTVTYVAGVSYTYAPWTPVSPIVVGGDGLSLPTGSTLLGGVRTAAGGSLSMAASSIPQLSPARTRTIVMCATDMKSDGLTNYGNDRSMVASALGTQLDTAEADIAIPPRYLHHNGTSQLLSVTAYFNILSRPGAAPSPVVGSVMQMAFIATDSTGTQAPQPFIPQQHLASSIVWAATHAYSVGDYVMASANAPGNGGIFKCLHTGTSGGSEPAWIYAAIGDVTTDGGGGVQWSYIGGNGYFVPEPNTPDVFFAGGLTQALTINLDPAQNCTLDLSNYRHAIRFLVVPFPIFVTAIGFTFGNITTMDFE